MSTRVMKLASELPRRFPAESTAAAGGENDRMGGILLAVLLAGRGSAVSKLLKVMARLGRLERPTSGSGDKGPTI